MIEAGKATAKPASGPAMPMSNSARREVIGALILITAPKVPNGITGGRPGRAARFVIKLGTAEEYVTPSSGRYELKAGERFLLQSAGGGGCGEPSTRDRVALAHDMAEGYVTAEGAKRDYGE